MKSLKTILCAAAVLAALAAPASAVVDPYYSGVVDSYTGEPVEDGSATATTTRVRLSDSMYYDHEAHAFVYPTGSGVQEVRASVADGQIVASPVSISVTDGTTELTVYHNGAALEDPDLGSIADEGSYTVSVRDGGAERTLFGFTIIGSTASLPSGYAMPSGFYIMDATLDDEDVAYERSLIEMEEEGTYSIEYTCPAASLSYSLTVTVDRTPPQLTFEGKLDKKGRFHSAVQIGGLENGDSVLLTRDGTAVSFPSNGKLTEAGMYQLQAFDAAGNASQAQFTILVYLDVNSLVFFALVCLSLAGVLGYILYKRRKLKVV